ncbi:glutaredoxin family protein [Desulfurobacterium thermolithotrophum DSM 11699]|uniref:Glutaredoxin family protein n=1 Tax=Desulfurobacterium thermolithotrophum (strain DSM 11699 / BSA) TaxID=868864 RepID=F0S297_DESTD|nr:thioredoxin family protein [Desulfurobacterium thermolithotrophum]ADY74112.1 glutaredoxin family protein [Desulfurobacterium thermolithotrophum DSM 11699]
MKEVKVISAVNCANCEALFQLVKDAVKNFGLNAKVEKVVDFKEVAKCGVLTTPILVVDGKVKHAGKPLPTLDQLKELIEE